jgi:hypothetical protein
MTIYGLDTERPRPTAEAPKKPETKAPKDNGQQPETSGAPAGNKKPAAGKKK